MALLIDDLPKEDNKDSSAFLSALILFYFTDCRISL